MYKKSLEMRHFLVFHYPEEPKLARSWAAGVARDGKAEQTAPMVAVGCIINAAQDAKTEILAELKSQGFEVGFASHQTHRRRSVQPGVRQWRKFEEG